ncbi:SpvB-domain-containing protein, partial [Aspergillus steynii IBT 23096]
MAEFAYPVDPSKPVLGNSASVGTAAGSQTAPRHLLAEGDGRRASSERFNVDACTGGMSFIIPIQTSPGRSGFGPSLSLVYESGSSAANGVFGLGWHLEGVQSISRKTSTSIPVYDDDQDVFVDSTVGEVVPVMKSDGSPEETILEDWMVRRYRARVESDPMRIERWTQQSNRGNMYWRMISSDNVTVIYGATEASRVSGAEQIFSWLACETYDSYGNHMVFEYKAEDANGLTVDTDVFEANREEQIRTRQRYLKSIKYGNTEPNRDKDTWKVLNTPPGHWMFEVVLDYGEHDEECPTTEETKMWASRPDPFSTCNGGFEVRTYRRCRRVLMFHHFPQELGRADCLVASTNLTYAIEPRTGTTLLQSCVGTGYTPVGEKDYSSLSLPPITLEYTEPPELDTLQEEILGLDAAGLATGEAQWVDLNGDGAPGVLVEVPGGGWYYHRNESTDEKVQVGGATLVRQVPSSANPTTWAFEDLTGDGLLDLSPVSPGHTIRGFYGRTEDGAWRTYTPFTTYPTMDPSSQAWPVYKFDLTGTGRGDLLRMAPGEDGELAWHASLGPEGYGPEQRTTGAPKVVPDGTGSLFLQDMSGDGRTDVVWVRNGNVSYWPNLGHGQFGARVIMVKAPFQPEDGNFSTRRIRMANITGFGGTDYIYLPPGGGAVVYYNQWGNGWSDGYRLESVPPLDGLCAVDVFDISGRGTQSLCWTSDLPSHNRAADATTVHFVDLMGGVPSGLLTKCSNGMGGECTATYRSSVRYCREDEDNGRPWSTKLPFSMCCIASTTSVDYVAQTSQTVSYAYHNGHYDPAERQFRGFQMVELSETEDFAVDVPNVQFTRPPVVTKSWFYIGHERLDMESVLPNSCQAVDERLDAYRALAGKVRRQETYSADGGVNTDLPYAISQQSYEVVVHQKTQGSRPGTFRVNPREEITAVYEREKGEPRVQQTLTLSTDCYGRAEKQLIVNYGKSTSSLPSLDDQQKQMDTSLVYTETSYTNAIDDVSSEPDYFHVPVVSETAQYRMYPGDNFNNAMSDGRYEWDKLAADSCKLLQQAENIPIEQKAEDLISDRPPAGYKALVSKHRTLYSDGNVKGVLEAGKLQTFSVKWQSYQLAATTNLLAQILTRSGAETFLSSAAIKEELRNGGYVELDPDEWWAPSARDIFGDDSLEGRLSAARTQFYLTNGEIDAVGSKSWQHRDELNLLTTARVDAVGNTTTLVNDYARLLPKSITDANGNITEFEIDSLGRRVGLAVKGKPGEVVGDSLDGFSADLSDDDVRSFWESPSVAAQELLKDAGQRAIYCLSRNQQQMGSPAWQAELVRDTHYRDGPGNISISITYLNGNGQAMQTLCLSNDETTTWQVSSAVTSCNGQQVKNFLPFFKPTHEFCAQSEIATKPATTFLLDPLDRTVGVLNADQTWSKTRITPWSQISYDAGDTVLIEDPSTDEDIGSYFQGLDKTSYHPTWYYQRMTPDAADEEKKAAKKSECYNDTPKIVHLNSRGNVSVQMDALGRVVTQNRYDLLGRPIHRVNMDSGDRWLLSDCTGLPVLSWSSGGPRKRTVYDALGRVEAIKVQASKTDENEVVVVKNEYGESYESDPEAQNLRGQLVTCWDQSGVQRNVRFDFKGNCIESSIQYATKYDSILDWSTETEELNPTDYTTESWFDAVGHALQTATAGGGAISNTFDIAGRLTSATSAAREDPDTHTPYVDNIDYAEGNEVTLIEYSNGSQTLHSYDPLTRRLARTQITRADGTVFQDISYTYDCLGKVVQKTDKAQQTIYFNNQVVKANQEFTYDALGQLCSATGREQVDAPGHRLVPYGPTLGQPNGIPGDGSQLIEYCETYKYDAVGNIMETKHEPASDPMYSPWTRTYTYEADNNRLKSSKVGSATDLYEYADDAGLNGCMTHMAGYSLAWDHNNQLRSFSTQRVSEGGTPERTWYIYNSQGKRVRKVTVRDTGARLKETLCLPFCDISITYAGNGESEVRRTCSTSVGSLSTSGTPLVIIEANTQTDTTTTQRLLRYQISDNLELDDTAKVISYEEYSPYGSSTYQARTIEAPRKYRFAAYHRDNESGLYLCGERYYASWLGRWTSPDPLGTVDGLNLYAYVSNDPINFNDSGG